MESLWIVLAVGTMFYTLSYIITKNRYQKKSEYQKEKMVAFLGRKYVKLGSFAASAMLLAATIFMYMKFVK